MNIQRMLRRDRRDTLLFKASQICPCAHHALYYRPQKFHECFQLLIVLEVPLKVHATLSLYFTQMFKFSVPLKNYRAFSSDNGSTAIFSDCLQSPVHVGSSHADFSTLKMEAIRSSETSVHTRSTRHHIPEDGILHTDRCENLKSYLVDKYLLVRYPGPSYVWRGCFIPSDRNVRRIV
jgi:hypothetical protein